MDLCDSNVWLALARSGHVHHGAARHWLEAVEAPCSVAFCRATQQSLLRLLTTTAVLAPHGNPPLTNREAWAAYEAFRSDDRIIQLEDEPAGCERAWVGFAATERSSPKLWMDAYLAGFARAARCRLVTTDTAFAQFDGLDLLLVGQR